MFTPLFMGLREAGVPVSLREYLTLLQAMEAGLAAGEAGTGDVETFYYLARASLVKDETKIDAFDRAFGKAFHGIGSGDGEEGIEGLSARDLPQDWLRALAERVFGEEEMARIEALGGFDALMETLRQRLAEQEGRHEGGSKWIGTRGTSPFGAHGYNPEGVRIGQHESRHRRAVKVWDRREFRDLDDSVELGTRAMRIALRRLRRMARTGAEAFDLPQTIEATAREGFLSVRHRRERQNAMRLLIFLDVGGSMDDHVSACEELFSAARSEFKSLTHYYFHNCIYEGVWTSNARRRVDQTPTGDLVRTFKPDTRVIFVGDAAMSPYEIVAPGGSVEHWNAEAGEVWLRRLLDHFPKAAWINPVRQDLWAYTQSTEMIGALMKGRMFPLTLSGLNDAAEAVR